VLFGEEFQKIALFMGGSRERQPRPDASPRQLDDLDSTIDRLAPRPVRRPMRSRRSRGVVAGWCHRVRHDVRARADGLRRSRYVGEAKTALQHLLTAAAINFVRMANWLLEKPRAKTRVSAFERVMKLLVCC
jgi:hypothetical protein